MQQQAEGLADPRRLAACSPEAALAQLLCTRAKIEFARGLRELHKAEVKMELRKHELVRCLSHSRHTGCLQLGHQWSLKSLCKQQGQPACMRLLWHEQAALQAAQA